MRPLHELKPKRQDQKRLLEIPGTLIGAEFEFYSPSLAEVLKKTDDEDYNRDDYSSFFVKIISKVSDDIYLIDKDCIFGELLYESEAYDVWCFSYGIVKVLPVFLPNIIFCVWEEEINSVSTVVDRLRKKFPEIYDTLEPLGIENLEDKYKKNFIQDVYISGFVFPKNLSKALLKYSPFVSFGEGPKNSGKPNHIVFLPSTKEFSKKVEMVIGRKRFEKFVWRRVNIDLVDEVLDRVGELSESQFKLLVQKAEDVFQKIYGRLPERPYTQFFTSKKGKSTDSYEELFKKLDRPESWDIKTERSLSVERGGLELVSPPLPPNEFFHSLGVVLEFIREKGFTNKLCGLHVGVSVPEIQKIRILKLFILLEDRAFLPAFPERVGIKWATQVKDILDKELPEIVSRLGIVPEDLTGESFSRLLPRIERLFVSAVHDRWAEKHLGINFMKLVSGVTPYIEFRYLGGSRYEQKEGEVKRAILYYLKAIWASMPGSTEGEGEYLRNLLKRIRILLSGPTEQEGLSLPGGTPRG